MENCCFNVVLELLDTTYMLLVHFCEPRLLCNETANVHGALWDFVSTAEPNVVGFHIETWFRQNTWLLRTIAVMYKIKWWAGTAKISPNCDLVWHQINKVHALLIFCELHQLHEDIIDLNELQIKPIITIRGNCKSNCLHLGVYKWRIFNIYSIQK